MEANELGAADGQVRPDDAWEWRLKRLMKRTPLAATALQALQPLADFADFSIEWKMLEYVVQKQERRWRKQGFLGKLGLPSGFMRFALAIFGYTLDDPGIYSVVNRVMSDPARGTKGTAPGDDVSPGLRACARTSSSWTRRSRSCLLPSSSEGACSAASSGSTRIPTRTIRSDTSRRVPS